jgi:hypothetical protein
MNLGKRSLQQSPGALYDAWDVQIRLPRLIVGFVVSKIANVGSARVGGCRCQRTLDRAPTGQKEA